MRRREHVAGWYNRPGQSPPRSSHRPSVDPGVNNIMVEYQSRSQKQVVLGTHQVERYSNFAYQARHLIPWPENLDIVL